MNLLKHVLQQVTKILSMNEIIVCYKRLSVSNHMIRDTLIHFKIKIFMILFSCKLLNMVIVDGNLFFSKFNDINVSNMGNTGRRAQIHRTNLSIQYMYAWRLLSLMPIMNSVSPLLPISITPIWTVSALDDFNVIKRFSFFVNFYFFSAFYSSNAIHFSAYPISQNYA